MEVRIVSCEGLWMESAAEEQLAACSRLSGLTRAIGMPDLHPSSAYPVGAVYAAKGRIYPALIGGDAGCGMSWSELDVKSSGFKVDKAVKRLDLDNGGYDGDLPAEAEPWRSSVGTIGSGNHFLEIQKVSEILDSEAWEKTGFSKASAYMLVHTGSRGFGEDLLRRHVDEFGHAGLEVGSSSADEYLRGYDSAIWYSNLNRRELFDKAARQLGVAGEERVSLLHNGLSFETIGGEDLVLHRKGAAETKGGLVLLPGSRGDYSYLVEVSTEKAEEFLFSIAHGAGRKWKRGDCAGRMREKSKREDLKRTKLGSVVVCENRHLLYEEAPEAYKRVADVLTALVSVGLAKPIARLAPILTYKTKVER